MPSFTFDGTEILTDADGFLADPGVWKPGLAAAMAGADGVAELTDEHWLVLNFIRTHWLEHGVAPMIRVLCRETGINLRRIYDLFPDGPSLGACRYAGLSKPDGCV